MAEKLVFELSAVDRATAPLKAVTNQITRTTQAINQQAGAYNRTAVATNKFAKGALQQAGYQVGDFFVQVTNGTSAMQAFGQQGSQMLGIFGPVGAILGAGVAIAASFGVVLEKTNAQLSDFTSLLGVLAQPIMSLFDSIKGMGSVFGDVFEVLKYNIDTALIAAGLFAGYMATKYVASMVMAAGASIKAAGAVGVLQTALLSVFAVIRRLLPIALFVGIAKLIEMFLALKKGAGGLGEAMAAVKNVFVESLDRMARGVDMIRQTWDFFTLTLRAGWAKAVIAMQAQFVNFLHMVARSLKDVTGFEDIALSIHAAAVEGASDLYMLRDEVKALQDSASLAGSEAAIAFSDMIAPMDSLNALLEKIKLGTDEIPDFSGMKDGVEDTGKAAKDLMDRLEPLKQTTVDIGRAIQSSMSAAMMSMVDGTKSVKDAFKDMARTIIMKLYEVMVVQRMVNALMGFLGGAFPGLQTAAPIAGMRAMGGQVTANKPYLVGERGPELVVPSRNAHVMPNNQLGGGQVVVQQTINVSTGVQQTVRAEIKSMLPQIAEASKAAVLDARRRGGNFSAAFG